MFKEELTNLIQVKFCDIQHWRPSRLRWRDITQEPLFPLLFTWFPVLFLFVHNSKELRVHVLFAPLGVLTIVCCLGYFMGRFIFGSWIKAALWLAAVLVLNFSYSAFASLFPSDAATVGPVTITPNRVLLPLFGLMLVVWFIYLWRTSRQLICLIPLLNGVSGVLVLVTVLQTGWIAIGKLMTSVQPVASAASPAATQTMSVLGYNPDVYYIIFDRYAGNDTIQEDYGYDNSAFLNYLKAQGFYVPAHSSSNYPHTPVSLASSLNMTYLQSIPYKQVPYPDEETAIYPMLQNTKVDQIFHQLGYKDYQMGSWFPPTQTSAAADKNFVYQPLYNHLDSFSNQLLGQTMVTPVLEHAWPGLFDIDSSEQHLANFDYQVDNFPTVAKLPGPKFVFVHMLMPHPPYVVDGNCKPISSDITSHRDELTNYLDHLHCANKEAESMVKTIMASSVQKPIIILQSDEGPYTIKYPMKDSVEFATASNDSILERTGILNAYYFPDGNTVGLYDTISPVNSFRLLFRKYFGMDYPQLDDRTYVFPNRPHLMSFMDVTDIVRAGQ